MISLSIDRRMDNAGLEVNGTTELTILCEYIHTLIPMLPRSTIITPSILKQRVKSINSTFYFCSFEFRIKNNFIQGDGTNIFYKNDIRSKNIANYLFDEMKEDINFENKPDIAYYHGLERFGLDYFAKEVEHAAIIIYIDYIKNIEFIQANRVHFCSSFAEAVNKLL